MHEREGIETAPTALSTAHMRAMGQATPEGQPSTLGCQPAGWSGSRHRSPGSGVRRGVTQRHGGTTRRVHLPRALKPPRAQIVRMPGEARRAAREPIKSPPQVRLKPETVRLLAHWVLFNLLPTPDPSSSTDASLGQKPSILSMPV